MKTITFYSYKGGVGRSLALANIATRLAEFNKRVCLLDFDLEAPGLHHKFIGINAQSIKHGIVDYIYSFSHNGLLPQKIKDYAISFQIESSSVVIDFIPAGRTEAHEYWKKLSSIDWYKLIYENPDGLAFFFDLKEKIRHELNPDFLLIDSRTGISEMSGVTLSLLADEVVIVAANNTENLWGCKKIIQAISNPDNILVEKPQKLRFVLSRVPFTDTPEEKLKELILVEKIKNEILSPLMMEVNIIHSDRELEELERIMIGYKIDEGTSQISKDYLKLFEELTKGLLSDEERGRFRDLKEAERLYERAVSSQLNTNKISLIDKALKLNPENAEYSYFKALILSKMQEKDAARDLLLKIVDNNDLRKAYILLFQILIEQKLYDVALVQAKRMLEIFPNDATAFYTLGQVFCNKKDFASSNKFLDLALQSNPTLPMAYVFKAINYRAIGNKEAALKEVYSSIELNSGLAISYFILAQLQADLGRIDEFYLSMELAMKYRKGFTIEKMIMDNAVFKPFLKEERFKKLLEKHNVSFPESFWEDAS